MYTSRLCSCEMGSFAKYDELEDIASIFLKIYFIGVNKTEISCFPENLRKTPKFTTKQFQNAMRAMKEDISVLTATKEFLTNFEEIHRRCCR